MISGSAVLTNLRRVLIILAVAAPVPAGAGHSPAIANWTKAAKPGEVLFIQGNELGRQPVAWINGWTDKGKELRVRATLIPLGDGAFSLRIPGELPDRSLYAVQVGEAAPVMINSPEAWWIGPDRLSPGAEASIFGRNLSIQQSVPRVAITPAIGGIPIEARVLDADAFRVRFIVPGDAKPGSYRISITNGASGPSRVATGILTVDPRFTADWSGENAPRIKVINFGATPDDEEDDRAPLQDALDYAAEAASRLGSTGVATVILDRGTYETSGVLRLPDRVGLVGTGKSTRIVPAPNFPAGNLKPYSYLVSAPDAGSACDTGTATMIKDLTLSVVGRGAGKAETAVWARETCGLHLDGLSVEAKGAHALESHTASYLWITNSTIVDAESFLGKSRQVFIDGNQFIGTAQGTANLVSFGSSQISITGNTARHLDSTPTANTVLTDAYSGRFYVAQTHWGWPRDHYISGNRTYDLAPHVELSRIGLDPNSGEQILFEGAGQVVNLDLARGRLLGATETSLTLRPDGKDLPVPGTFVVTSGKAKGVTAAIETYDPTTGILHFLDPLPIVPDATSKAVITQAPRNIAIIANQLDGRIENVTTIIESASAGVQVYPGATEVVIERNIFSDIRAAIAIFTFAQEGTFVGATGWDIRENRFQRCRDGIVFAVDPGSREPSGLEGSVNGFTIRGNDFSGVRNTPILHKGHSVDRAVGPMAIVDNRMSVSPARQP
jgi:hypothetical protein